MRRRPVSSAPVTPAGETGRTGGLGTPFVSAAGDAMSLTMSLPPLESVPLFA